MRWAVLAVAVVLAGCQRPCTSSTCSGCCVSETECVEGTSLLECGSGGEACTRCTSKERCLDQRCEPLPVVDAGVVDAGPVTCGCSTSCCLPDGSCAPNNGIEACGPAKSFCGACTADQRCEVGVCVPGACGGCLDPLGRCKAGTDPVACGADGGVCEACGVDQACRLGRCVYVRCDMNNCRFGCCQPDLRCVTPSVAACGIAGGGCVTCATGQQCLGGTCQ